MVYNIRREVFPANLVARISNFATAELFQIEFVEQAASKVSLT
jgi:hypothetical protein